MRIGQWIVLLIVAFIVLKFILPLIGSLLYAAIVICGAYVVIRFLFHKFGR